MKTLCVAMIFEMIQCIVAKILTKIDVSVMAALICIFTQLPKGRPEDNQVEFLQGTHGILNPPKNLVLNNIRRFTMEHIGAANGILGASWAENRDLDAEMTHIIQSGWQTGRW